MLNIAKLEINRNITKTSIGIFLVFLFLSSITLQIGIEKYNLQLKEQKEFVKVEAKKIKRYINYLQLGGYGFRRLLEPSPLMAMAYNSTTISDLQAFIDSGVRLQFSKPEIGKNLFERPTGGILDFSWYLLLAGSLIVMPWAWFTFRSKEYMTYLMNFAGYLRVFWGIILARILLLIFPLFIMTIAVFLQYSINGITLTPGEIWSLWVFLLVAAVTLVFLMVASAGLGAVKSRVKAIILTVVLGLFLVLLWPEILNVIFSGKAAANMKSRYKHEIQKIEILMEFEREAFKQADRYKKIPDKVESDRQSAEHYWNNVRSIIEKIDLEMIENTQKNAREFHLWSSFNPVTLYKAVNNELSSKGYNTYTRFFKENQAIQEGFLRFYFDRRFYENYSKVEPYLSEGENIVRALPGLPAYFVPALAINCLYILFGLFFSYLMFKRRIYPLPDKADACKDLEIHLKKKQYIALEVFVEDFTGQFLNLFQGKCKKFKGKVTLEGESIVNREKEDFVYLPNADKIPKSIKTGLLISAVVGLLKQGKAKIQAIKAELRNDLVKKKLSKLEKIDKAGLLLKLVHLKNPAVYILHDFGKDMPQYQKTLIMDDLYALKNSGCLTIDIISGNGVNIPPDWHAQVVCRNNKYHLLIIIDLSKKSLKKVKEDEK